MNIWAAAQSSAVSMSRLSRAPRPSLSTAAVPHTLLMQDKDEVAVRQEEVELMQAPAAEGPVPPQPSVFSRLGSDGGVGVRERWASGPVAAAKGKQSQDEVAPPAAAAAGPGPAALLEGVAADLVADGASSSSSSSNLEGGGEAGRSPALGGPAGGRVGSAQQRRGQGGQSRTWQHPGQRLAAAAAAAAAARTWQRPWQHHLDKRHTAAAGGGFWWRTGVLSVGGVLSSGGANRQPGEVDMEAADEGGDDGGAGGEGDGAVGEGELAGLGAAAAG